QNMFTAAKTANKYELADTNLKETYEVELTKVQGLIAKADVTKSEIDQAKSALEAAFNAFNGDTKLTEIEKEIDKLNNLSDDQKQEIKNLVTNADTQEKANQILEKAKGLDKAIGDLKAKIQEAKNTKQDPIYSSDTSDKKSAFDDAITESETKLDEHLKVNLGNLSAEQILEKAKEVQADIKTLDDEIKKLDGKKQAIRDEINAYSTDLISEEEKKSYIERIDALDRTNPNS
ncbi:GA module-containing protein, partial [Mycoplasmopsis pullorum]|uniref:GA module-containing protein n=2 Tax=Mycoplasmopsis pullorum TaxID=48003 RepID=UPI001118731E